ncbi:MAG: radical SAM protein [Candidatus Marinimicrobia bacterium]|nr:radical SAM protein [Candidatus Neomarinimicrobiota bacterium]
MKKVICLIQPPIEDFYGTPIRNYPLGLLSVAAAIREFHPTLIDLRNAKPRPVSLPAALKGVSPFYRPDDASPFSLYKRFYRFGLSDDEITQLIPGEFDIFLISAMFTTYSETVFQLIRLIHERKPSAVIIVGGADASVRPENYLQVGADFVIAGEGEIAAKCLLDELEKTTPNFGSVPNLVWQKGNKIVHNPVEWIVDLDALPFADAQTPGTPDYFLNDKLHAMILASRGCPNRCEFCSIHLTMGDRYRIRSVSNVLDEMGEKIAAGIRSFDFEDDHFGGNRRWLAEFLDGVIERFPDFHLSLQAMNGITASNLNAEILKKMKQAGFSSLNVSLVTPGETMQTNLKRPFGTKKFIEIVNSAHSIGLSVTAYIIIGLPCETTAEILNAILLLAGLPCLIGPSLFYLVPSTPVFDRLQDSGKVPDSTLCYRSSHYPVETQDCTRLSAMTLFRICRIVNFLKSLADDGFPSVEIDSDDDKIHIPEGVSGKESQKLLGVSLLRRLYHTGILYGTGKKQNGAYPLVREKYSPELLESFLNHDWKICGFRSGNTITKAEIGIR